MGRLYQPLLFLLARYRNHQGLGNELIDQADKVGSVTGTIKCRERLGGMLKYYH